MAIDSLVAALDDADSDVREAAAIALGRHGDPGAADALAGSLCDLEPGVRVCAAVALSKLGWSPRSPEEEALFGHAISELGQAASSGETALQPLLEELTQAIADRLEHPAEPAAPFEVASELQEPDVQPEEDAAPMAQLAVDAPVDAPFSLPGQIGDQAPPDAGAEPAPDSDSQSQISDLESQNAPPEPEPPVAHNGAPEIPAQAPPPNGGPTPEEVAELVRAADEADTGGRVAAIYALNGIEDAEATATLLNCLDDSDPVVRLAAGQVLGERGDPAFTPSFLARLTDDDPDVQLIAIRFVSRISDPQVIGLLCPLLAGSDVRVRRAAAQSLAELKDRGTIEDLVVALLDEDAGVRVAVTTALEAIDRRWASSAEAQNARPRIQELITRPGTGNAAVQLYDHLKASLAARKAQKPS